MFILCAVLTSFFAATAVSPASQATFDPATLPVELRDGGSDRKLRGGLQMGTVTFRAFENAITIDWIANALNNSTLAPDASLPYDLGTDSIGLHAYRHASQTLTTRFYPTACSVLDGAHLLVAGVTAQGVTVIERWEVVWPSPMPALNTDPATGRTHVNVVTPPIGTRERWYQSAPPVQRFVRNLSGLQRSTGSVQAALVQFHDSADILRLDVATHQLTVLASGNSSVGALGQIPSLASNGPRWVEFGDRDGIGFTYMLRPGMPKHMGGSPVGAPPVLVLIDQNRDGSLDQFLELSPSECLSNGWWDLANYNKWWLY